LRVVARKVELVGRAVRAKHEYVSFGRSRVFAQAFLPELALPAPRGTIVDRKKGLPHLAC
jgi:hypothetical protein